MITEQTLQDLKATAAAVRPEFFRLPRTGERDPYFGGSRSYYYQLEREGSVRLVHVRPRGKARGITLVPYDAVVKHVRQSIEAEKIVSNGGAQR
jgi:hypothetical protein